MEKLWQDEAWEAYLYWQTQDKKTLKKINRLIQDIDRNGYQCQGQPEPLKGELSGFWSVRIDEKIVWFSVSRMGDSRYGSAVRTIGTNEQKKTEFSRIQPYLISRGAVFIVYIQWISNQERGF